MRYNKGPFYTATVYFEPTVNTSRLRKGAYAYITDGTMRGSRKVSSELGAKAPELPRYVQISDADAPFTGNVAVPELDLIPFDHDSRVLHATLSDEEWVALVDLVRPVFKMNGGGPICRVRPAETEGVLRVFSGWQEGPLAGGGRYVEVKRKSGGGFELVGDVVGIWMS